MDSAFIDDGYTLDGYIAERHGLHSELQFTYRPLTRREDVALVAAISSLPSNEQGMVDSEQKSAECVAKHLVSWSLKNRAGAAVPISPDNVQRLQPIVAGRLLQIIRGREASDRRPAVTEDPALRDMDAAAKN